jgi:nucleotide-binding universal stress UspA family protein
MQPKIHRILVPLDFSPPSDYALTYAKALAADFGASLHLLHVIEDRLMTGPWPVEVYLGELPRVREGLIKDAEARMLECLKSIEKSGIQATGEVVIGGPFQTIVDLGFTAGMDLIVMSTHGRTGITHLLIGSVAERVIRHAQCPVLVVREREAAERATVPMAAAG